MTKVAVSSEVATVDFGESKEAKSNPDSYYYRDIPDIPITVFMYVKEDDMLLIGHDIDVDCGQCSICFTGGYELHWKYRGKKSMTRQP